MTYKLYAEAYHGYWGRGYIEQMTDDIVKVVFEKSTEYFKLPDAIDNHEIWTYDEEFLKIFNEKYRQNFKTYKLTNLTVKIDVNMRKKEYLNTVYACPFDGVYYFDKGCADTNKLFVDYCNELGQGRIGNNNDKDFEDIIGLLKQNIYFMYQIPCSYLGFKAYTYVENRSEGKITSKLFNNISVEGDNSYDLIYGEVDLSKRLYALKDASLYDEGTFLDRIHNNIDLDLFDIVLRGTYYFVTNHSKIDDEVAEYILVKMNEMFSQPAYVTNQGLLERFMFLTDEKSFNKDLCINFKSLILKMFVSFYFHLNVNCFLEKMIKFPALDFIVSELKAKEEKAYYDLCEPLRNKSKIDIDDLAQLYNFYNNQAYYYKSKIQDLLINIVGVLCGNYEMKIRGNIISSETLILSILKNIPENSIISLINNNSSILNRGIPEKIYNEIDYLKVLYSLYKNKSDIINQVIVANRLYKLGNREIAIELALLYLQSEETVCNYLNAVEILEVMGDDNNLDALEILNVLYKHMPNASPVKKERYRTYLTNIYNEIEKDKEKQRAKEELENKIKGEKEAFAKRLEEIDNCPYDKDINKEINKYQCFRITKLDKLKDSNPSVAFLYGTILYDGSRGVKKNKSEAKKYFFIAAAYNIDRAYNFLSERYEIDLSSYRDSNGLIKKGKRFLENYNSSGADDDKLMAYYCFLHASYRYCKLAELYSEELAKLELNKLELEKLELGELLIECKKLLIKSINKAIKACKELSNCYENGIVTEANAEEALNMLYKAEELEKQLLTCDNE